MKSSWTLEPPSAKKLRRCLAMVVRAVNELLVFLYRSNKSGYVQRTIEIIDNVKLSPSESSQISKKYSEKQETVKQETNETPQ